MSAAEHETVKSLTQRHNLRDSMTTFALALTIFAEETAKDLRQARNSEGFGALHRDTGKAGDVGGAPRRDIEQRTGRSVVSFENYKSLTARVGQAQLFGEDVSQAEKG
jgi:hypothetical protein